MLDEKHVEAALDWLRDNADEAAQAAHDRYLLVEGRKSRKAELMKQHADLPVAAQEREAYADPQYKEYLKGVAAAIHKDEKMKMLRRAAEAKIEAWRSHSANLRSMKI